ncbi:MAG: DUF6067 family protein, partial [Kiritimatiellae bacterium]|nr:DUF6067 family protein [Kiritimatiellia bacterium]
VTGLLEARGGEVATDQSAFYLGYDATNLYVAMSGDMTEQARENPASVFERFLRTESTGRNEAVTNEDAVEILLSPSYWQAPHHREPGPWQEHRLLLNSAGGYAAMTFAASGKSDWDVSPQVASKSGAAGWQFEARIPLAALGATPAPGDRWGLQFGRVWKMLKDEHDVWAWGRRDRPEPDKARMYGGEVGGPPVPFQPDPVRRLHSQPTPESSLGSLGAMRFAGNATPLVRVERLGAPGKHSIDFRATLSNPGAAEQKVRAKLGTDTEPALYDETVSLPAGGQIEIVKSHSIADYATSRLVFEVWDAAGALIHRTCAPFFIEQRFGVKVAQMPNLDRFLVQLDLGAMADVPVGELRVDLQLTDTRGQVAYAERDRRVAAHLAVIEGNSRRVGQGQYTLSTTIRRGEAVLAREEQPFTRAAKAPWYDNRHGFEDVDRDAVPYPWTDMEVGGRRSEVVSVWGREYRLGQGLLPEQITTLGAPLLRASARLVIATADGHTLDSSRHAAKSKWRLKHKTRVEGVRTLTDVAFTVENQFWAEYDGLVWCTVTVKPKAKTTVTSLEIELPLTREASDVIKAGNLGGKLKPEGWRGGGGAPWVGNGDGGLQLFPPSPWRVLNEAQSLRVEVTNGAATIRAILVDAPMELDGPHDFTLGLMATPARPKVWRTPEDTSYRLRVSQGGGGAWYPPGYDFKPAADIGRSYRGDGEILYVWTATVNIKPDASGADDFALYGAEWLDDPFQRPSGDMVWPTLKFKSYGDYFAWRYWRYQCKYGYRGLYYDNPGGPSFGVREMMKRLYNITLDNPKFGERDTDIGLASNGGYDMRFGGFATYQWNGENLNSAVGPNDTYRGILDPDVFRAEYMGHNWGWPARLLGQGRVRRAAVEAAGGPEAVQDHVDGLVLLHDTAIPDAMPCCIVHDGSQINQVAGRLHKAIEKLGFYHWAYQFVPYWQQQLVALPRERMYASWYIAHPSRLTVEEPDLAAYFPMYRHLPEPMRTRIRRDVVAARAELAAMKDRAILVVYNDSDWAGELRLKPEWQQLGLGSTDTLTASNAVHSTGFRLDKEKDQDGKDVEKAVFFPRPEEFARIEGEELVFPMTRWNYRMIVLEVAP